MERYICCAAIGFLTLGCTSEKPVIQSPPPLVVSVAKPIVTELIDYDEYTGQTRAIESVEIRARVSGYLQQVHFKDGDRVQKDDLLFTIDPRPYEAEVNRSQGDVERLVARVDTLQKKFDRESKLLASNAASQEEFDVIAGEFNEAKAGLASAQASLEKAKLDLGFTQVRSPLAGRASRHLVSVGNLISAGGPSGQGTLLTTVVSVDPMYVYVDASEAKVLRYMDLARQGKRETARTGRVPMYIGLANEEGTPHAGIIDFVDNTVDPDTGTIAARGRFDNKDDYLLPGFFARVRIPGSGKYKAILVPDRSIGSEQTQRFVYVVNEKNEIEVRYVELGATHEMYRVVTKGLGENERVVISALARVRPGMVVKPEEIELSKPADLPLPEPAGMTPSESSSEPAETRPSAESKTE